MKLRLKQNTIRIRMTRDEVNALVQNGTVQDQTRFTIQDALTYRINLSITDNPAITLVDHNIDLFIPAEQVVGWQDNDLVGFSWDIDLGNNERVSLLIEKDFQCLTSRPGEDESNLYANPNQPHT